LAAEARGGNAIGTLFVKSRLLDPPEEGRVSERAGGRAAQQVVDCKFEDCDARNGARIVGMDDLAHVVGTPVDAAFG